MFSLKSKNFLSLVLFLLLVLGFSQAEAKEMHKGQADFMTMDNNHDNSVTWDEYKDHYPKMEKGFFHNLDTNKDSHLSKDEWKTHEQDRSGHKK